VEDAMCCATQLRCKECGRTGALADAYVCEECFGPLEVAYDLEQAARTFTKANIATRELTLWRYRELLPCAPGPMAAALPTGMSPLVPAPRLAERLGLAEVWIKNETVNPTHSFKDRVVTVALEKARQLGFRIVACASTGNLANSVAAHAAARGLESYVFIPSDLEEQKVIATSVYGGSVVSVDGTYDDVNRLCVELAGDRPWAFVNVNVRPYYAEGSKTLAFETAEQLGWELPDRCVVPIASGSLYTKIKRGFGELRELGLVEGDLPAMTGAQSAGCGPVAAAWQQRRDFVSPVVPSGIAKSLAIGNPADGIFALDTARQTGGEITSVSEHEIVDGIRLLAETTGIFTETAGGVTTAALAKQATEGGMRPEERVVVYITGDGLKTLDAVASDLTTIDVEPTVSSLEEALRVAAPVGAQA